MSFSKLIVLVLAFSVATYANKHMRAAGVMNADAEQSVITMTQTSIQTITQTGQSSTCSPSSTQDCEDSTSTSTYMTSSTWETQITTVVTSTVSSAVQQTTLTIQKACSSTYIDTCSSIPTSSSTTSTTTITSTTSLTSGCSTTTQMTCPQYTKADGGIETVPCGTYAFTTCTTTPTTSTITTTTSVCPTATAQQPVSTSPPVAPLAKIPEGTFTIKATNGNWLVASNMDNGQWVPVAGVPYDQTWMNIKYVGVDQIVIMARSGKYVKVGDATVSFALFGTATAIAPETTFKLTKVQQDADGNWTFQMQSMLNGATVSRNGYSVAANGQAPETFTMNVPPS